MCHRHPRIEGLVSIFSRSVPQTSRETKAWPAYSAEVCHRHPKNWRPGQHIRQKCATNIPRIESLASIFSRSVPQTFQKSKAWRRTGSVAQTLEECTALAACSPAVSHKRPRNMQRGQHMHQKAQPHIAGIRGPGKPVHQRWRGPINFRSLSARLRSLACCLLYTSPSPRD